MNYVTHPHNLVFSSLQGLACVIWGVGVTRIIVKLDVLLDMQCI